MAEIELPKAEFNKGTININLSEYLPKEKKKNLAKLSDEELAQLSPEELEEAKRASGNLLAIKQVTKEVDTMENQEKWAAAVQQFAQEHDLSIEEAERTLKQRAGLGGKPSEIGTLLEMLQPKPSPIEEALSKAIASRVENIATTLFPNPPANTGGGPPQAALSDALKQAKESGAQSLYLPDGTVVKLTEDKGGNQDSILNNASAQIQKYVTDIIDTRLPTIFSPQPPGMPQTGNINNPEIARLAYEDKWKQEDRTAQDAIALRRDGAIRDIAAVIGAAFSPEGYKKLQKMLKEGPTGEAGTGKKEIETKPEGKLLKTTCWRCMRVYPYEEGQDPVCPYCGQAQKVQCPGCEEVFIPKRRDKIVCPKCHVELQEKPEEQGKPGEGEEAPEEAAPGISVGQGILE